MQLVKQHVIGRHDPRYAIIDEAAFKSKNLYNAALYEMRQAFFNDGIYLNYNEIQRRMQSHEAYKALLVQPSGLSIMVKTQQKDIHQLRIVPRKGFYVVEVVYEKVVEQAPVNSTYYAGIDIGMDNLVALTSNKPAFQAVVVNGRPVKSVNQFYNKRNRRIDHYMHTARHRIVDLLV